jgi:transposase InsO family protein
MSDNGCKPTSVRLMKLCRAMDISQAFTSDKNPQGNADTERFMRILKKEMTWINEWDSRQAFIAVWISESKTKTRITGARRSATRCRWYLNNSNWAVKYPLSSAC